LYPPSDFCRLFASVKSKVESQYFILFPFIWQSYFDLGVSRDSVHSIFEDEAHVQSNFDENSKYFRFIVDRSGAEIICK
jgi:hypothetical protein